MSKASNSLEYKEITTEITQLKKDGQIKKAIEFCRKALNDDPTNPQLHINLGDLYLQRHLDIYHAKQYVDEAITEYQRALESNINSGLIHYKIGIALYHKGELDKSISHLNIAISHDVTLADAYFVMARALSKKDRLPDAIENAELAIKYSKFKSSRAHFLISHLLTIGYQKSFHNCVKAYSHLVMGCLTTLFDNEGMKELYRKSGYFKFIKIIIRGFYLEKIKNVEQAIDLYTEAIEEAPGFIPMYIILGDVYKSIGKYEEAINEYKMAIWHDPVNVAAHKALCQLYEDQNDYDRAIETYKKLIVIHPKNPVLYSNIANILYLKGNPTEAIKYYQNAISLNPSKDWTSVVSQTLGYVFQEATDNHDAAISAYQSAYLLNPKDIDIYISLGSVFYEKGDYENALNIYRIALELEPKNSKIHCNLAYLLWGRGKIEESVNEYKLAIKYDPEYDVAHNNLGVIYLDDLGRVKEAVDMFEKAMKCNPNYALAYYNLGRALTIKGNKIEAARLYQIALDINTITNELDNADIRDKINNLFD
jgi:tetratricopeptide (TPR) repeat protein